MIKYLPIALILMLTVICPVIKAEETSTSGSGKVPSFGELLKVVDKAANEQDANKDWSTPVKMVIIFAGLAILPSLMVMMTSFTRIVIVMSFIRRALTTQNIPPTVAIIGLSLFLTMYTMAPTFSVINEKAIQPYLAEEVSFDQAWTISSQSFKGFMLAQCRESDLELFLEMANVTIPEQPLELGLHIVVPAFIISEFRTAFEIGCLLFIPFLLIDLVTANILLSAGMMMLPPAMISLPFKLILFILVDGWALLAKSLCMGFNLTG